MPRIFKHIRKKLVNGNGVGKYMTYAIGEILLVVIGILIALQINNWNEARKKNVQLQMYRQNLLAELKNDLVQLNGISNATEGYKKTIYNYLDYYNSENPDVHLLVQKMDSLNYLTPDFSSSTYSIEEIISTGNLSLFSELEKNNILKLKTIHIEMEKYRASNLEDLQRIQSTIINQTDLLHFYGYSTKQHPQVANWKYDMNSLQFRLFNNELAGVLYFYENQEINNSVIKEQTRELVHIIEELAKP